MLRGDLLQQLDEHRRSVGDARAVIEVLPWATRVSGRDGEWHQLSYSKLSDADADAVIAAEVAHFRALGGELEWTVYAHDEPSDLLARLERHGFEIGPREVVLVLDLAQPPSWVSAPGSARVERVTTPELLQQYCRVSEGCFGRAPERVIAELAADMRAGSTHHVGYVAFDAERAVSIGRLDTAPSSPFAGLYGGATLPSHRGKGFYRATVAARASDAARRGARYVRVDALPTSQPILERLGFIRLTEAWPCLLVPNSS